MMEKSIKVKCAECYYEVTQGDNLTCHFDPPKLFSIPKQGNLGQIEVAFIAIYPSLVPQSVGCGKFRDKS